MNKRDIKRLTPGTHVRLKHNLGEGKVQQVFMHESDVTDAVKLTFQYPHTGVKFPAVLFTDQRTQKWVWCTYLVIESFTPGRQEAT